MTMDRHQGHQKDVAVIAMAGGADDEALRGIAQSEEGSVSAGMAR